jgi:hypothetical protein
MGVQDDGSWGVGFVPDEAGVYDVDATCFDAETGQPLVDYKTTTFDVTQRPAPPTTAPPPTTPPPTEEPAPPAAPVPAEPSFTG